MVIDVSNTDDRYSLGWLRAQTRAFVSVAEVSKVLGVQRATVIRRIHDGEIIATKVGRQYLVDRVRLLAYIDHE